MSIKMSIKNLLRKFWLTLLRINKSQYKHFNSFAGMPAKKRPSYENPGRKQRNPPKIRKFVSEPVEYDPEQGQPLGSMAITKVKLPGTYPWILDNETDHYYSASWRELSAEKAPARYIRRSNRDEKERLTKDRDLVIGFNHGDWSLKSSTPIVKAITHWIYGSEEDRTGISPRDVYRVLNDEYFEGEGSFRFDKNIREWIDYRDWIAKYDPVTHDKIEAFLEAYSYFDDEEDEIDEGTDPYTLPNDEGGQGDEDFDMETQLPPASPEESAFDKETQDGTGVPDWMTDIDEDTFMAQDNQPSDPEKDYPLSEFLRLWDDFSGTIDTDIVRLIDHLYDVFSDRFLKRIATKPSFTENDVVLKRTSGDEYYRIPEFYIVLKYVHSMLKELLAPNNLTGAERYVMMAKQWVVLAEMQGMDNSIKALDLPLTGVVLDTDIASALAVMQGSFKMKMEDTYIKLIKEVLTLQLMCDFFLDLLDSLVKASKENPAMSTESNLKNRIPKIRDMLSNAKKDNALMNMQIDGGNAIILGSVTGLVDALGKVVSARSRIASTFNMNIGSAFRFVDKLGDNFSPRYDFANPLHPGTRPVFRIETTTINGKRRIKVIGALERAHYKFALIEEGVDYTQHAPANYVDEYVDIEHAIEVESSVDQWTLQNALGERLGAQWDILVKRFFDLMRESRKIEKNETILSDTRDWLLAHYNNDVAEILSLGSLPEIILPTEYEGDYEKRPLSIDDICLLSTENHYRAPGEPWRFDAFIPPSDDSTEDDDNKDPMFGFIRQRIYNTPPITVKVFPDDKFVPPVYPLRVVLRPSVTKTEAMKAAQLDWVIEQSRRETAELGNNIGQRYNLLINCFSGPKNNVLSWLESNSTSNKILRTHTSQWIVTVNTNMNNALLYSRGGTRQSFQKMCEYYLSNPSEEFVRGRKRDGSQSNITTKNIVRWNVTKTVIEDSPSRHLVHFHGLLQVTYMYFQSTMVEEPPPQMVLDYKAFITYMQLFSPNAYVNFTSVKKYLDEQDEKDFQERWQKYIEKGMKDTADSRSSFVGVASRAVKTPKRGKNRKQYQYKNK